MNPRLVEWICTACTAAGFLLVVITQSTLGIVIGVMIGVISMVTMWRLARSRR